MNNIFNNNNTIIQNKSIIRNNIIKDNNSLNKSDQISFEDVLKQNIENNNTLKFSKHAQERLKFRNINFNNSQLERINSGIDKASAKGIKESLVLVDNTALVVSIKNNTVITAINNEELKNNVFTNIDGAIIV